MISPVSEPASWTGRRVVVLGDCTTDIERLVALGAEVHVVALEPVAVVGLASVTPEDPRSSDGLARAASRIGAVVDVLHDCTSNSSVDAAAIFASCFADHSVVHTGAVA
jgi:hypothetical protein